MSLSLIPRNRARHRSWPTGLHASREADRLFEDFFGSSRRVPTRTAVEHRHAFVPRLDVMESEEAYTVSAELPGVKQEDFEVVLEDNVLTLKGEKKPLELVSLEADESEDSNEAGDAEQGAEPQNDDASIRRSEMRFGSFERRVAFRSPIAEDDVKARYADGLLTITIPKPVEELPRVRTVPVENG